MNALPWHAAAWRALTQRLDAGRFPHALLIAGDAGLGKRALAERLIARLLCSSPAQGEACGACRSCMLRHAGTHPDLVAVTRETNREGKLRADIVVDQIRDLCARLAMTSQLGGRQLARIDPADAMNTASANALLKTLEEPSADSVLILIADRPARLPQTVRSRCQRVDIVAPPRSDGLAWLEAQGVAEAEAALDAAGGNPGLAARWVADGSLARRREVAQDLAAIARGREHAASVAARWTADAPEERLWFAAQLAARELTHRVREGKNAISLALDAEAITDWFARANRAREDLRSTLRAELVVLELLDGWR